MNTSQYILNIGLLAVILGGNLGTRTMTVRRLLVPVVLVAVAGYVYLRAVPTAGNDTYLEIAGATLGALLGVAAAALVRVHRDGQRVLATAGAAFAALWIAVVGGRILFAYGATHWFSHAIGTFSIRNQLGAGAWTAAFVLMALAMVIVRVAIAAVQRTRALHAVPATLAG